MAITRTQKEAQVEALVEELGKSSLTVLTSYSGLSVADAQQLRNEIKSRGGNFRIVKNAMFKIAVTNKHKDINLPGLEGPIAVAFGYDDPVMPAKAVADYSKTSGSLEVLGAIDEQGQLLSADQVKQLANLPSREVLTAQLVGTIAAPLSGFINILQGNLRGLVTALDAVAKARET